MLFVNGIPLVVIECKRPELGPGKDPIEQAISQHIRNQKDDGIPQLFLYSQLLLVISKNAAKYATTGTSKNFWTLWREDKDTDKDILELINQSLSSEKRITSFEADSNICEPTLRHWTKKAERLPSKTVLYLSLPNKQIA